LSRNTTGDFETIVANCIAHARRKFVEVADSFPEECEHVLTELAKVYKNDAVSKMSEMSPEDRLSFHKENSGPVMRRLKQWLQAQLDEKLIEPNSGLGDAIGYSLKHWDKLTLFLTVPGAPIDNNICERVLKKAILHRKNALFFKTENGANVGDLFMSLIHTCELNAIDPFNFLTEVQRHADVAEANPADWLPWIYRETLQNLGEESG
jgi:transposase